MVLKTLSDAVDALEAAVKAETTVIDAFLATQGSGATPAEQQALADRIITQTNQVTTDTAKFPPV